MSVTANSLRNRSMQSTSENLIYYAHCCVICYLSPRPSCTRFIKGIVRYEHQLSSRYRNAKNLRILTCADAVAAKLQCLRFVPITVRYGCVICLRDGCNTSISHPRRKGHPLSNTGPTISWEMIIWTSAHLNGKYWGRASLIADLGDQYCINRLHHPKGRPRRVLGCCYTRKSRLFRRFGKTKYRASRPCWWGAVHGSLNRRPHKNGPITSVTCSVSS